MDEPKTKKAWLDFLYYKIGRQNYDFRMSGLYKDKEGVSHSTKWFKYSEIIFPLDPWDDDKIWFINNREILPNEVVLDIENKIELQNTINKLKKLNIPFYIFDTHSHGFHVHMFFNEEFTAENKNQFVSYFNADSQKSFKGAPIALEFTKHWKSGLKKEMIYDGSRNR